MGNKLTTIQDKLLKLLQTNLDEPLSYRDLAKNLDVVSTNTIAYHLQKLERHGYLKRDPYNPRNYQVLGTAEPGITYLNMYGLAHCGPNGSMLDGNPIDRISISTRLIPCKASEAFLVKAKGDSMEPRIHSGDVILARRQQTATDGEVVVCVNNGETLIKRFVSNNGSPLLISLNQAYNPIVASKDFRIEGAVKSIIYSAFKPTF